MIRHVLNIYFPDYLMHMSSDCMVFLFLKYSRLKPKINKGDVTFSWKFCCLKATLHILHLLITSVYLLLVVPFRFGTVNNGSIKCKLYLVAWKHKTTFCYIHISIYYTIAPALFLPYFGSIYTCPTNIIIPFGYDLYFKIHEM